MGPYPAIRGTASNRGPLFVSRTADHAEIHRQFSGRPIFSSRLVTILFPRFERRKISALYPKHRSLVKRIVSRCGRGAVAFYQSLLTDAPCPKFAWISKRTARSGSRPRRG